MPPPQPMVELAGLMDASILFKASPANSAQSPYCTHNNSSPDFSFFLHLFTFEIAVVKFGYIWISPFFSICLHSKLWLIMLNLVESVAMPKSFRPSYHARCSIVVPPGVMLLLVHLYRHHTPILRPFNAH